MLKMRKLVFTFVSLLVVSLFLSTALLRICHLSDEV